MISKKLATSGHLRIKVSWTKGYGITISVLDITKETFLSDLNYIVDDQSLVTLALL